MHHSGFTLLEVLVAFIIAALALTALYEGGLGGLRATDVAGRYLQAVSRAQSHLDAATVGDALTPSDRQGDEGDGYHWRVRITQAETAGTAPPAANTAGTAPGTAPGGNAPGLALYTISVGVSWVEGGRRRAVELDTQRVAPVPPPPL